MDFLTKKQKVNEGEIQQYYVKESHPAIIQPEIFDLVQHELKKRRESGRWQNSDHCYSGRIICGECGSVYGSKVWHSNTPYRRVVWQCNDKRKKNKTGHARHLYDTEIQAAFLAAFNRVLNCRKEIMTAYNEVVFALTDTTTLDADIKELDSESNVVLELIRKLVSENASTALDQEEYQKRYNSYSERFESINARISDLSEQRLTHIAKRADMERFISALKKKPDIITEFDEELWYMTVDYVKVYKDKRMVFVFRDGGKIEISADMWGVKYEQD